MPGRVLGTIALLLFVVCGSAHGAEPSCGQDGSSEQVHSLLSASGPVTGGAAIGSETVLRISVDRSTGQQDVRRSIGRLLRPGAASVAHTTHALRPASRYRFPTSSPLTQAGLPAWSTATPPPSFQR